MRTQILALLVPALLVGGCSGTPNRGLESVHQPVVSTIAYAFDATLDGGALAPGEAQRLSGWMGSLGLGRGDQIAVDDSGYPGAPAREQVAAMAARFGASFAPGLPVAAGTAPSGTIRVVASRLTAQVPGCPDYSRMAIPQLNSHTSSNYGCAINANLAAMIANPEDLVRGRSNPDVDTATATKAITTYRTLPNTGNGALKSEGVR